MTPNPIQSPEERRFLQQQAQQLQQQQQTCKIVTRSEHSILTGRIAEVQDGGLVLDIAGTGERLITGWNNVAELIALSGVSQQQGQQQQSFAAGASGYPQSQYPR